MDDADTGDQVARWETVAALFTGLSHRVRIAILESLAADTDRPLTAVGDEFDYSRSAIQKHVETLIEADLVYRPQETDQHYALTPFGQFFAAFLDEHSEPLYQAMQQADAAEAEAQAEFEDVPLDEATREKAVTNRKWDRVSEKGVEELDREDG
ncbi:winged helix-turn-helix domain-containing protein [Natronococcus sp. A-GB1]|uniref:ArsR/SmtB family transcription factor n=1 Tax=Natronococcus sp. A-GB1 TaxID=3037648 RepID=UPI00241FA618|nr:winged helix-turn-helix domain-containing protein [Natronococcus sp. A-GB1]MDG5761328.1 winged helix-turn-helix domain-containing protein [Natronococcus sp. A-GB1]